MEAQFEPNTKIVLCFKTTEVLTEHPKQAIFYLSVHTEREDDIYTAHAE